MLLMNYPSIRAEYLLDCAKNSVWKFLHAYIDTQIQILIDEYPGDGVQAISRIQSQCSNMTFYDQGRHTIML